MAGQTKTFDYALYLHDGGSITSSAAGEIGGSAKILDLGAGVVYGDIVVDVTELDVDSNNEIVTVGVQISDSSTFSSGYYQVASLALGDASPLAGDTDMTTGRYIIPFNNMIADGVAKRYLRLYFTVAGTVAGFNCTAYLALKA
jgi:hypothetical protein